VRVVGRWGYVAGRGSGARKQAVVRRGCELEPGSYFDPHTAFSGASVWIGTNGALICTDGLVRATPKRRSTSSEEPLRTGKVGRPRLILPQGVTIAQEVIKRYARRRVISVCGSAGSDRSRRGRCDAP
jgi:hypothetical protein